MPQDPLKFILCNHLTFFKCSLCFTILILSQCFNSTMNNNPSLVGLGPSAPVINQLIYVFCCCSYVICTPTRWCTVDFLITNLWKIKNIQDLTTQSNYMLDLLLYKKTSQNCKIIVTWDQMCASRISYLFRRLKWCFFFYFSTSILGI